MWNVGLRQIILAVSVLAAMGGGFWLIRYIQDTGKKELQIESLENNIQTRERIDEAIRTAPVGRDAALDLLRDFLE